MIDRYANTVVTSIWSDDNKIVTWLKIELIHLLALQNHGIINTKIPNIDVRNEGRTVWKIVGNSIEKCVLYVHDLMEKWKEEERKTHHDIAAFIHVLEEQLPSCGRFIHYGMTSSDLCDTELALRISESTYYIIGSLHALRSLIYDRSLEFKDTPIIGRTHGMYAEPTTFGLILLNFLSEIDRHLERLHDLEERIAVGKISGAVGTYAHIPPSIEVQVLSQLGLDCEKAASQIVSRDRHAELINALALIGTSIERFAIQIRHLSRSEIMEVSEQFIDTQKGSSAMPHKRNPIRSENLCGLARMLRGFTSVSMENMLLWHERDISHSSAERFIFPDSFGILAFIIERLHSIVKNMFVDTNIMKERVIMNRDYWKSQSLMLNAIQNGMSRKEAHDKAQKFELDDIPDTGVKYHLKNVDTIFKRF